MTDSFSNPDIALVLENGFKQDIPDYLTDILCAKGIKWDWYDMRQRFWPKNREVTLKFFSELPVGKSLYCHTVFDGFQQLELFVQLLHGLREKQFTFKIMHGCLVEDLTDFLNEKTSTITPKEIEEAIDNADSELEWKTAIEKEREFKKRINEMFFEVLESHNIYWLRSGRREHLLKTMEDIKNLNE